MAKSIVNAQRQPLTSLAMNRRQFLLSSLVGATALVRGHASVSATPLQQDARPNVLFIVIDDLNDWVGCLNGHPNARTPNIDSLAKEGTLFANAHCAAPVCNPSRTSVLTGLHPSATQIFSNTDLFRSLYPDLVTLPQHFLANGYEVMGGGKIFHHADPDSWSTYYPYPMFELTPEPRVKPEIWDPAWQSIRDFGGWPVGPIALDDGKMFDAKVAKWAISQLEAVHTSPFFLAVGIRRPHSPLVVPDPYFDLFAPESVTLPPTRSNDLFDVPPIGRWPLTLNRHNEILEAGIWQQMVSAYLACTNFADAMVGRILNALAASPYADNTVVVLFGDNGWHLGQKEHWGKETLWQESTHVPLIIRSPNALNKGTICRRPVSLVDIYPTLIELCGLSYQPNLAGHSLVPLIDDPLQQWDHLAVTTAATGRHAVISEDLRYIRYEDGSEELYDHRSDPNEWTNLACEPAYDEVKAELKNALPPPDIASFALGCFETHLPSIIH